MLLPVFLLLFWLLLAAVLVFILALFRAHAGCLHLVSASSILDLSDIYKVFKQNEKPTYNNNAIKLPINLVCKYVCCGNSYFHSEEQALLHIALN